MWSVVGNIRFVWLQAEISHRRLRRAGRASPPFRSIEVPSCFDPDGDEPNSCAAVIVLRLDNDSRHLPLSCVFRRGTARRICSGNDNHENLLSVHEFQTAVGDFIISIRSESSALNAFPESAFSTQCDDESDVVFKVSFVVHGGISW